MDNNDWDNIKFAIDHKNSDTVLESIGDECLQINKSIDLLMNDIDLSILEIDLLDKI